MENVELLFFDTFSHDISEVRIGYLYVLFAIYYLRKLVNEH